MGRARKRSSKTGNKEEDEQEKLVKKGKRLAGEVRHLLVPIVSQRIKISSWTDNRAQATNKEDGANINLIIDGCTHNLSVRRGTDGVCGRKHWARRVDGGGRGDISTQIISSI
jgi:hypothetical protein